MSDLPLFNPEADEISPEDLQAAAAMHDQLQAGTFYESELKAVMARTIHRRRVFRVTRTDAAGELFINTVAEYSPEAAIDFCKDWDAEDARAPFSNYIAEERSTKRA